MRISAWIECIPKGKGRPRMGKGGHVFTPKETVEAEQDQARLLRPYTPRVPLAGAVTCRLIYALPIPESWSAKRRAAAVLGDELPTTKGDVDNFAKLSMDVLTELGWWKDDAQVVSLVTEKVYAEVPGLRVIVEEVRP